MPKIGAEMGQLQGLGKKFSTEAQTVAALRKTIDGQVGSTWWEGPAANRFKDTWRNSFAPTLVKLEQALKECSTEVKRRHEALERAGS